MARSRLYLVLEARPHAQDPRSLLDAALRGGVDIVQLRDKELGDDALVAAAEPFRMACQGTARFSSSTTAPISSRRAGRTASTSAGATRRSRRHGRSSGPIGCSGSRSRHCEELGDVGGADYVGVTAFTTPTKKDAVAGGLELVRAAAEALTVPWFAIGGIDLANADEVVAAGAPGIAVVRAIRDAVDPEASARMLRAALDRQQ